MPLVKTIGTIKRDGEFLEAGDTFETSEQEANSLVALGVARLANNQKANPNVQPKSGNQAETQNPEPSQQPDPHQQPAG